MTDARSQPGSDVAPDEWDLPRYPSNLARECASDATRAMDDEHYAPDKDYAVAQYIEAYATLRHATLTARDAAPSSPAADSVVEAKRIDDAKRITLAVLNTIGNGGDNLAIYEAVWASLVSSTSRATPEPLTACAKCQNTGWCHGQGWCQNSGVKLSSTPRGTP